MSDLSQALAKRLEGGRVLERKLDTPYVVEGLLGGHPIRIAYWLTKGRGWSVSSVSSEAAKLPLLLVACPHTVGDHAVIKRGGMVDVQLGDAEFDQAWRVEGAPADTIRRILDREVRRQLLPFDVAFGIMDAKISMGSFVDRLTEPRFEELVRAAEIVAAVAERVALTARDLAADDASLPQQRAEVERLQQVRLLLWKRATWPWRMVFVFAGLVLLGMCGGALYGAVTGILEELR